MKAMVVRQPGGLDAMCLESIPEPVAGPKDVVIEVEACGVCFHDVLTRNGTLKAGVKMPCVWGHEISGTVLEVGSEVKAFKAGQKVATAQRYHICGACRFCRSSRETLCAERKFLGDYGMVGGYAEYVAVEDDNVAAVPEGAPLAEASIAACAIGTALNGVRDVGQVKMGESVLVTGAGGGVGLDVLIDNVGTVLFEPMRRSLGTAGRWVLIGQLTGDFVPFNPAQLFLKNQSMLAVTSVTRNQLQDVLAIMGRGQVKAVVTKSL